MTRILTHRGLDPSQSAYFPESSYAAFADQLARGFGLEVDLSPTQDGELVLLHDADLRRISGGTRTESVGELTCAQLQEVFPGNGRIATLDDILSIAATTPTPLLALHSKGRIQDASTLDLVGKKLDESTLPASSYFIFDLLPESAAYMHRAFPELPLAASIAHPYDIERYGTSVGNTLLTLERVLALKDLYSWVVLDEWDRQGPQGIKTLHTQETYDRCRSAGFKIMTISPELHATSPALYGGEAHTDAASMETLTARMEELLSFKPEAYCTDYPDLVQEIIKKRC